MGGHTRRQQVHTFRVTLKMVFELWPLVIVLSKGPSTNTGTQYSRKPRPPWVLKGMNYWRVRLK